MSSSQERSRPIHAGTRGRWSENGITREERSSDGDRRAGIVYSDLLSVDKDPKNVVERTVNPFRILLSRKDELTEHPGEPRPQYNIHLKYSGVVSVGIAVKGGAESTSKRALSHADLTIGTGATRNHIDGITGCQDNGIPNSLRAIGIETRAVCCTRIGG